MDLLASILDQKTSSRLDLNDIAVKEQNSKENRYFITCDETGGNPHHLSAGSSTGIVCGAGLETEPLRNGTQQRSNCDKRLRIGQESMLSLPLRQTRKQSSALPSSLPSERQIFSSESSNFTMSFEKADPNQIEASLVTPIPMGRARTSEHIERLYSLCAEYGYDPKFEYDTVSYAPVSLYQARLSVAGLSICDPGPFRSKKEAKEASAEKGCKAFSKLISAEKAAGRKVATTKGQADEDQGPKENYIGLLQGGFYQICSLDIRYRASLNARCFSKVI